MMIDPGGSLGEVKFGILGRLQVRDDRGAEVPVPAARQRVLLAALLLHAERVVPVGRLAEIVWDGDGPADAHNTVRSYAQRLRGVLGPDGAARIVTRDPGYLMRVGEDEFDYQRARTLAAQAAAALTKGEFEHARAEAVSALSLWRDAPLVDVRSRTLHDAWDGRLEELRLQVLERRIEAELRLGAAESLLSELAELIRQHPLREHLRGLHMSALAAAGRRADALSAYLAARQALVDAAGIEPGAELRTLHQKILADEGELPPHDAAAESAGSDAHARAGAAVGCQLPTDTRLFTGRAAELRALIDLADSAIAGTARVTAIDGMGGAGKTTLAVHAAHRLRVMFPDGQLFLDLHGHTPGLEPLSAEDALEWLLRSLGVAAERIPADPGERAALYRARLDGSSTLIILDNAASAAQVRPLLPGADSCLVMVTSRRRLTGLDEAAWLSLDTLPEEQALDLLSAVAGAGRIDRRDPAAAQLVTLCGHLPLAIRIVAARLRSHRTLRLEDLLDQLRNEGTRLGRLRDEDRDPAAVFASSYAALPRAEQRLFRLLGHNPGMDLDVRAAAAVIGSADLAEVDRQLETLLDHNLLSQHEEGRYRFHDLVRLFATALAEADDPAERDAARDRLWEYYLRGARAADRHFARHTRPEPVPEVTASCLPPVVLPCLRDRSDAQAWMRAERANLLAAAYARPDLTVEYAFALSAFIQEEGPWDQITALHRAAIQVATDRGDLPGEAGAQWELGRVLNLVGDYPAAAMHLERALAVWKQLGNPIGQANALWELGRSRGQLWEEPAAIDLHEQALALFREVGDRLGEANALWGLGSLAWSTGDTVGSVDCFTQALAIFRGLGHRLNEFDALMGLGLAHWLSGDLRPATEFQLSALSLARELGNRVSEAGALTELGRVHGAAGRVEEAAAALDGALALFQDLELHARAARARVERGQVYLAAGDVSAAAGMLDQALAEARAQGAQTDSAYALVIEGAIHLAAHDVPKAFAALERSRSIARNLNVPLIAARAEAELARAHHASGDSRTAYELLDQARAYFRGKENRWGLALVALYRAAIAADDGDAPTALTFYQDAEELARQSGAEHFEAQAREGIARCAP